MNWNGDKVIEIYDNTLRCNLFRKSEWNYCKVRMRYGKYQAGIMPFQSGYEY